jgi:hypothetical protein
MSAIPTTNLHITPSNVLSSGVISYKSGNPVIQFIIGEQSRALLGQSLRICGDWRIYSDSAKAVPTSADSLTINSRLGAYSMIDQLVIKSQKTHAVIEHIRHYGRAMASFLPYSANTEDEVGHMSESSLTMPNESVMQESVVRLPGTTTPAGGSQSGNNFCMHLPCGLFNGTQAIPLDLVGGLLVEIHLAPDQNVIVQTDGVVAKPNAFYELKNVFLACEAQVVTSPPSVSTFEYNSLSSYFASFNSTNAIINFNLGLNNVLSVFANIIPANHINNLGFDGFSTMPPVNSDGSVAPIRQMIFTRGGEKFPIEYNIDTLQKDDADYRPYDPQLEREGAGAVRKFGKMARTMVSPNNSYMQAFTNGTTAVRDGDYVDGGNCFILGVNYDSISNQGVSFATQDWGMNMITGLTTENPHAVFLFVHSKNTLVFDGKGGMQVIS